MGGRTTTGGKHHGGHEHGDDGRGHHRAAGGRRPFPGGSEGARVLSRLFFDELTHLEEGTPEYQYARNTLIEMNMSLVRFAAGRFRSRGPEEMEDIVQVGMIG